MNINLLFPARPPTEHNALLIFLLIRLNPPVLFQPPWPKHRGGQIDRAGPWATRRDPRAVQHLDLSCYDDGKRGV